MSKLDDILQKTLDALDRGEDLDIVLAQLSPEEAELAKQEDLGSLVRLASAVMQVPQPPHANKIEVLMNNSTVKASKPAPVIRLKSGLRLGWAQALVGAAIIFVLLISAAAGGIVYASGPSRARTATLMDIVGIVESSPARGAQSWDTLESGQTVSAGERIRTGIASEATLLFYDGSRMTLAPNSEVELAKLQGSWTHGIKVVVNQDSGKTTHSVVPLKGGGSLYQVRTPNGTADVHGTNFSVGVEPGGKTLFAVRTGEVAVSNGKSSVSVPAGQAVTASADTSIDPPSYSFSLQGELTFDTSSQPYVAGQKVLFDRTAFKTGFSQGDYVVAEGRILSNGDWVADGIGTSYDGTEDLTFTGKIQEMGTPIWIISTVPVSVTAQTELVGNLNIGVDVEVTFYMQGETRIATRIAAIETPPPPGAEPILVFQPDNTTSTGCDVSFVVPGTLANIAQGDGNQANDISLTFTISKGGEYINNAELVPAAWPVINPGEQVPFNVNFNLKPEFLQAPSGTEVQVIVFVVPHTNAIQENPQQFVVTIQSTCDVQPTEPVPTEPVPTEPVPTEPVPTEPGEGCPSAEPHPVATRLAREYGVPYEEIMGWKCSGFGFGEIDLAYGLSREFGIPVANLFNMKASGEGWGNIKKWAEQNRTTTPVPGDGDKTNNGNNGNGDKPKKTKTPKPKKNP